MAQGVERSEEEVHEFLDGVYESVRIGMSINQGLDLYGIEWHTLLRYKKKFPAVDRKLKQAEADYLRKLHESVERHSEKDGALAIKALSKRDKTRWGDAVDVTSGGNPIQLIDFSNTKGAKDGADNKS